MIKQEEINRLTDNISYCLNLIEKYINIDDILSLPCNEQSIVDYYNGSRIGYRLFHNLQGAMHTKIDNMIFSNAKLSGFHAQSKIVNSFIPNNKSSKILEVGCGNAFNLSYLAYNNSKHQFYGIDVNSKQIQFANRKYKKQNNISLLHANFESLPFNSSFFETIFDVEALCYAHHKTNTLTEIHRVLKSNGYFVQFNGFTENDEAVRNYNDEVHAASKIVAKSMSIDKFHEIHQWVKTAQDIGFQKTATIDISLAIQNNINLLQKKSFHFFRLPSFIIRKLYTTAPYIVLNAIAGLLIPYTINIGIYRYYLCVFQKKLSLP